MTSLGAAPSASKHSGTQYGGRYTAGRPAVAAEYCGISGEGRVTQWVLNIFERKNIHILTNVSCCPLFAFVCFSKLNSMSVTFFPKKIYIWGNMGLLGVLNVAKGRASIAWMLGWPQWEITLAWLAAMKWRWDPEGCGSPGGKRRKQGITSGLHRKKANLERKRIFLNSNDWFNQKKMDEHPCSTWQ